MSVDALLHESSVGYALFKVKRPIDSVGNRSKEVQESVQDLSKFGKLVELVSFTPFQGAAQALESINDASEGIVSSYLKALLELNLPKLGKRTSLLLVLWTRTWREASRKNSQEFNARLVIQVR